MCSRAGDVHVWRDRPNAVGAHRKAAVMCSDYIRSLENALIEATGDDAAPQKALSGTPFADGTPAP